MNAETRRHEFVGLGLVIGAVVMWSTAEVVTRKLVGLATPLQLGATRFSLAALILCAALPFELRRKKLTINRRIVFHAAWISFFGVTLNSLAFQYSLEMVGAGIIATLFGVMPMFTLVLGALFLGERFTGRKVAGVVAGFAGVAVLAMHRESGHFSLLGLLIGVMAPLSFGLFTVCAKRFAGPFAGLPFTTLCFLFGSLALVPMALVESDPILVEHFAESWPYILYLAVGTTGLSYIFYFVGLERVEASHAATTVLLKPPLAVALAAAWLGEPLTWNMAVALVLVLGGLYLVVGRSQQPVPVPASPTLAPQDCA